MRVRMLKNWGLVHCGSWLFCSFLVFFAGMSRAESNVIADLVLTNAKVFSLRWDAPQVDGSHAANAPLIDGRIGPDAEAIAIKGRTVLAIGNAQEIAKTLGPSTKVFDLNGASVFPGLIDSHVHIAELGQVLSRINLIGAETPQAALNILRAAAVSNPSSTSIDAVDSAPIRSWVLGQGWDEGAWANNYPTRQMLDEIYPDQPVVLKSLHGFAVWLNSAALAAAGIDANTAAPSGGEILKDEHGAPTGILLNRATTLIDGVVPEPNAAELQAQIVLGLKEMASRGYVAVHEAGATAEMLDAFAALRARNALPIRVYAMLSARDPQLVAEWLENGALVDTEGWYDVRSVKAYYDGALGSRGARLLDAYTDQPGHKGVSGSTYGFDRASVAQLMAAGFQVGIHAIGDAGNRETLDFIAEVYAQHPSAKQNRHRIEHAQVVSPQDLARFAELDVIASMEPPHAVEDKTWAEQRLGSERIKGAYAWRSLRMAGADITFNSDLPGSDHDIFYGLHAAVTRRDKQAMPTQGWQAQEVLTMEESIRAYTDWAAYAAFREAQTGTLQVGKWADITVLDIDPFASAVSAPEALLEGRVLMTVVDGKVVYSQKASNP